jgi:hypothetical protein
MQQFFFYKKNEKKMVTCASEQDVRLAFLIFFLSVRTRRVRLAYAVHMTLTHLLLDTV